MLHVNLLGSSTPVSSTWMAYTALALTSATPPALDTCFSDDTLLPSAYTRTSPSEKSVSPPTNRTTPDRGACHLYHIDDAKLCGEHTDKKE
jgi:hypothetical protein